MPKFVRQGRRLARRAQPDLLHRRSSTRWASTATPPARSTLDGAVGTLVGQPHKGLPAMFVMMNAARLGVGNQSPGPDRGGLPERRGLRQGPAADAQPVRARRRRTSRPTRSSCTPTCARCCSPRAPTPRAARALALYTALLLDKELATDDDDERKDCADEVALLTPIVKAFLTDNGWIATSHCMQVFGGHGYIARVGHGAVRARCAHQHDLRGHQHHPGAGPAGPQGAGRQRRQAEEVRQADRRVRRGRGHQRGDAGVRQPAGRPGRQGHQADHRARHEGLRSNADEVGAAAVDYLRVGGHLVLRLLLRPHGQGGAGRSRARATRSTPPSCTTARFYFAKLLPETAALIRSARAGVAPLMAMDEALF
ncbi:MAG: acyl-CoA dehydrogenase C-terminal domain-containing protein [Comamonadaceae bacterium]|nr:acyl-CoA dehydrogenase C-terminal domain-containing protein [Comamonadaceae bacterium]